MERKAQRPKTKKQIIVHSLIEKAAHETARRLWDIFRPRKAAHRLEIHTAWAPLCMSGTMDHPHPCFLRHLHRNTDSSYFPRSFICIFFLSYSLRSLPQDSLFYRSHTPSWLQVSPLLKCILLRALPPDSNQCWMFASGCSTITAQGAASSLPSSSFQVLSKIVS